MVAKLDCQRGARGLLTAALAGLLLAGCADPAASDGTTGTAGTTGTPADPSTPPEPGATNPSTTGAGSPTDGDLFPPDGLGPVACDPAISVKSDSPALLVRDPAVLTPFSLERVLTQLISLAGATGSTTPLELLQRLFDTENTTQAGVFEGNTHCDSPDNGAFKNGLPTHCPRAEGALAKSTGLFAPGDADFFAPVALVNRFDLTPSSLDTCGEYRIVFAKWSGRSDPNNRLFLIFEGALANHSPGDVMGCRPVAKTWAALEKESDPAKRAARLEELYFTGLPGFTPLVHPDNFGLLSTDDQSYGHSRGQVRVSQRMEDPWELREFHFLKTIPQVGGPRVFFAPATVKNSPTPSLFAPGTQTQAALDFRASFLANDVPTLVASQLSALRTQTPGDFNAGESMIGGLDGPDYAAQVASGDSATFLGAITAQIAASQQQYKACPPGDPLTAEDILHRAALQSCAGCHAPQQLLGPAKKLGCGLSWPSSLGEAHIDEKGTLSAALTDAFLPHRASVLTTYLQACDLVAIEKNLQQVPVGAIPK